MEKLTKEKTLERIDELIRARLVAKLHEESERLLDSGALEVSDYKDDYILARLILSVALESQAAVYFRPTTTKEKRDRANLRCF